MNAIDKAVRKKITLAFLLIGVPSVFLLTGGMIATTFGESNHNPTLTILGYVAVAAGFILYLAQAAQATQISRWEARERQQVAAGS